MSMIALLTVTAGPDAGREFVIEDELVHIGTGEENHFRIADDTLSEHQVSIAHRTGRFAIYAPLPHAACVDGNELPAEKWVWLPPAATIKLGPQTLVRFATETATSPNGGDSASPNKSSGDSIRESLPESATDFPRKPAKRRGAKSTSSRNVAKFITDRPGVPLVKLGEDGKLPELRLADASQPAARREAKQKSPVVLYGVIAFSFALSLGMLLIDSGPSQTSSSAQSAARSQLVDFFGKEGEELQRYQVLLRQAHIDHSRGDYEAERAAYHEVLRMLNSADIRDRDNPNGLTGKQTGRGRASDDELRGLLETLIAS